MKLKSIISCLAAVFVSATAASAANIATWNFESLVLTTANTNAIPNGACGNIAADSGTGTASALHATAATVYNTVAGNGSSKSLSANNWLAGDYYQFSVSTVGSANIVVTFDQVASATGPGRFQLQYSTDGTTFLNFGAIYNVTNVSWSTTSAGLAAESYAFNLSSITALNNASLVYFRLLDANATSSAGTTTGTGGTCRVDNFQVSTLVAPAITLTPSAITTNAGTSPVFTTLATAGTPPFTYFWYSNSVATLNLMSITSTNSATNSLTIPNVVSANSGTYFVVVSNSTAINATLSATLTVIDPAIDFQPVSQTNFPGGTVQFAVNAGGTGLSYLWRYCKDPLDSNQITAPVTGTLPHGSVVFGGTSNILTITNLQAADVTNFAVVVSGTFGAVTSYVASLVMADSQVPLAAWNFNYMVFNVTNPAVFEGIGFAYPTNVVSFSQPNPDANDTSGYTDGSGNQIYANTGWGTQNYPNQGTLNTNAGVTFAVSTAGAKNIKVSYDVRETATASKYHRLQYTTNGIDFIDYPSSTLILQTAYVISSQGLIYDLSGFAGVANNTNFAVRLVSEYENTATYGTTNDALYAAVGATSTYGTGGTISYDLVSISGDAITNANVPPTIGTVSDLTVNNSSTASESFTVTTPYSLTSVVASQPSIGPNANPPVLNATVALVSGTTWKVTVAPNVGGLIQPQITPLVITATDIHGDVKQTWFYVNIVPANQPPLVNGLPVTTNLLGTSITIPFTLADDHTDMTGVTPVVTSGNATLVANTGAALGLGGAGTTNRTLTITPAPGLYGSVPITIAVTDNGPGTPLTTSASFNLEVRQTTNQILIDNFDYDAGGAIDTNSAGLWANYSGHVNEMVAGSHVVTIDGVAHTEDVQAKLIGAPYPTNSSTVLYSRYYMNYSVLPDTTGSYITYFTDGTVSNFVCRVWAVASATPGMYQVGIAASTNIIGAATLNPMLLSPGVGYVVVTRLVLASSQATLWINPVGESSAGVTAIDPNFTSATQYSDYDLRESSAPEGTLTISNLMVGKTFASVTGIAPTPVGVFTPLNVTTTSSTFNWNAEPGFSYSILWSTNVGGPYNPIATGLTFGGTSATSGSFTDTVHTNLPTSFYRVSSP